MTTTTNRATPDRSLEQRMQALRMANRVRCCRAQLKRDLKARRVDGRDVLLEPPDYLLTARVWDVLMALPRWGRTRVNRVFTSYRVSPSKTVGGLSERQRRELAAAVGR